MDNSVTSSTTLSANVAGNVIIDVYILGSLKTPLLLTALSAIILDCAIPGLFVFLLFSEKFTNRVIESLL